MLATVLLTDILDSTAQAATMGDRAWRRRLDEHESVARRQLARFRGREIKTMGDGFLAAFDGPTRAIRCAGAIRDEARRLGVEVRAGPYTGEVELLGDDLGGSTVNIGARYPPSPARLHEAATIYGHLEAHRPPWGLPAVRRARQRGIDRARQLVEFEFLMARRADMDRDELVGLYPRAVARYRRHKSNRCERPKWWCRQRQIHSGRCDRPTVR
jgi:hypothetical protein